MRNTRAAYVPVLWRIHLVSACLEPECTVAIPCSRQSREAAASSPDSSAFTKSAVGGHWVPEWRDKQDAGAIVCQQLAQALYTSTAPK